MTTTAEPISLQTLDDTGRALLFTDARTANAFADVPVTDEELAGIWDLARWSPSMANSQPLRVLFVASVWSRYWAITRPQSCGSVTKACSDPVAPA